MTSFIVITLEIGQSAGKIPKSVMIRTRYSLNDVESNVFIHITSRVFYKNTHGYGLEKYNQLQ